MLKSYFDAGKFWPDAPPNLLTGIQVSSGILAILALSAAAARSRRLRQTLTMLGTYSVLFTLIYVLVHLKFGDKSNEYELPAGGGTESIKASSVKIQKIVRKKFLINPYSSIVFNAPPPIDKIDVKLIEETANQYKAGQGDGADLGDGDGDGEGFGSGTAKGKVRFFCVKHSDSKWNKNFGIDGDQNLLIEYVARRPKMRGKVATETESIDIAGIATFPEKKSPPLIYIGGVSSFSPSAADKKVLKQYLTERHGMILGDNLGGQGFHQSFVAAMNEITKTTSVVIPRDDLIHARPYAVPNLPVVVAHGGTSPLGWKIDGRWVVYYHPGALSDGWRSDHAGIKKKELIDSFYDLGINIVFYAHREYNQWLKSQQP